MNKKLKQALYNIAANNSYAVENRGDLEKRHNDSEDFLEISVWAIQNMLKEAYELGRAQGEKQK